MKAWANQPRFMSAIVGNAESNIRDLTPPADGGLMVLLDEGGADGGGTRPQADD